MNKRKKNKDSAESQTSKQSADKKNTQVLIITPELLQQMGINLSSYQSGESPKSPQAQKNTSQIKKSLKEKLTNKINKNSNQPEISNTDDKLKNEFRVPKVPAQYTQSSNLSSPLRSRQSPITNCPLVKSHKIIENKKDSTPTKSNIEPSIEVPSDLDFSPTYLEHLEKTLDSDLPFKENEINPADSFHLTESELAILNSPTLTSIDAKSIPLEENFNLSDEMNSSFPIVEDVEVVSNVELPNDFIDSNVVLPPFQSVVSNNSQLPCYFYDESGNFYVSTPAVENDNVVHENTILQHEVTENVATSSSDSPIANKKKSECFSKVVEYLKAFKEKKTIPQSPVIQLIDGSKSPVEQSIESPNEIQSVVEEPESIVIDQQSPKPSTSKSVIETDDEPEVELRLNSPSFGHFNNDEYIFKESYTDHDIPTISDDALSKFNRELNNIECSDNNVSLFDDLTQKNSTSDDENAAMNREFFLFHKKIETHQINQRHLTKFMRPKKTGICNNKTVQSICSDFLSESEDEVNAEKTITPILSPSITSTSRSKRKISRSSRYSSDSYVCLTPTRRKSKPLIESPGVVTDQKVEIAAVDNEPVAIISNDSENQPKDTEWSLPPKKKFGRGNINKNQVPSSIINIIPDENVEIIQANTPSLDSSCSENPAVEPEKKKRGRKKKAIAEEEPALEQTEPEVQEKNTNSSPTECEPMDIIEDNHSIENVEPVIETKRPGRKKKIIAEEKPAFDQTEKDTNLTRTEYESMDIIEDNNLVEKAELVIEKKKPGRKKKVTTEEKSSKTIEPKIKIPETDTSAIESDNESMNNAEAFEDTHNSDDQVANMEPIIQRRNPGRKKKGTRQENDKPDEELSVIKSESKKRGRKKKIILDDDAAVVTLDFESELSISTSNIIEDSLVEESEEIVPENKKRGRKKIASAEIEQCDITLASEISLDDDIALTEVSFKKKPGRKRKIIDVDESGVIHDSQENPSEDSYFGDTSSISTVLLSTKKRGRKPKYSKNEETSTDVTNTKLSNPKGFGDSFECALCVQKVKKTLWRCHSKMHNYLAWRTGDRPIDLENDQEVMRVLEYNSKHGDLKKFICEKCKQTRISAYGFLTHFRLCGKSEQEMEKYLEQCPMCDEKIIKYSLQGHIAKHKNQMKKEQKKKEMAIQLQELTVEPQEKSIDDVSTSTTRKRRAAVKALDSLKNIDDGGEEDLKKLYKILSNERFNTIKGAKNLEQGLNIECPRKCEFECNTLDAMKYHLMSECPNKWKIKCIVCSNIFDSKEDVIKHLHEVHESVLNPKQDGEDETSDSDHSIMEEVAEKSKSFRASRRDGPEVNPPALYDSTMPFKSKDYKTWAREFFSYHYSSETLFPELQCKRFVGLLSSEIGYYLPIRKQSCPFAFTKHHKQVNNSSMNDFEWKKFGLYDSSLDEGVQSFWCGGFIRCLAWTPSDDDEDSFLAVGVDHSMDAKYRTSELYSQKNILQIWNCGKLSDVNRCSSAASMMMGIAHDFGVIWDMQWCPSGCYDNSETTKNRRIGLLALACSDGFVRILAICNPKDLPKSKSKFFKTQPVASLKLYPTDDPKTMLNGQPCYPTKLLWSQEKSHNVIIVGYSNGMLAYFDLSSTSPLVKMKVNNQVYFLPFHTILAHTSAVNGIAMIPRGKDLAEINENLIIGTNCCMEASIWNGFKLMRQKSGNYATTLASFIFPQFYITSNDLVTNLNRAFSSRVHTMMIKYTAVKETSVVTRKVESLPGSTYGCCCPWCGNVVSVEPGGDITVFAELCPFIPNQRNRKTKTECLLISYPLLFNMNNEPIQSNYENAGKKVNFMKERNIIDDFKVDAFTYDEAVEKYGVLFVDVHENMYKKMNLQMQVQGPPMHHLSIDRYPLQTTTCIATNPSASKHSFIAHGGPSGLVRVLRHQSHPQLIS